MSKSTLPWFRFYTETISDTKFDVISNRLQCSKISLLGAWSALLSLASKSPVRGSLFITNTIPYTTQDLAAICGTSIEWMEDVLGEFAQMEMIETVNNCYSIKNWNKRQFESDSSTERVKEFRERYSNVTVTPPDTDTDTDTDIQKENNNGSSEPLLPVEPEKPKNNNNQSQELAFDTPGARVMVALLGVEKRAKGYKSPKAFPSIACKNKWINSCEKRLSQEQIKAAVTNALQRPILDIPGIVDYVSVWHPNGPPGKNGKVVYDDSEESRKRYITGKFSDMIEH